MSTLGKAAVNELGTNLENVAESARRLEVVGCGRTAFTTAVKSFFLCASWTEETGGGSVGGGREFERLCGARRAEDEMKTERTVRSVT